MEMARWTPGLLLFATAGAAFSVAFGGGAPRSQEEGRDLVATDALAMIKEGRETFRHDTFGDEAFWGGQLGLHRAIAGRRLGGIGPGLTPVGVLRGLGLKVDVEALPAGALQGLRAGKVNLTDPAATVELLRMDAVVGVKGVFDEAGDLASVGITCALCHSTVDDSVGPGLGRRLDGWANRDLDAGALVALAPDLSPFADLLQITEDEVRAVLQSWGPGRFDAELILDGQALQPDGSSAATLIPPAFGLAGVNLRAWTRWGGVSHWNAFVAALEMHGQGAFVDARLADPVKLPVAAQAGFDDVRPEVDLGSAKLPALHFYQLALRAPEPPEGSFDPGAASRGRELFHGRAQCATCHEPPTFTEPGWNLRLTAEAGIDGRTPTTPLQGLWTHQKGGFYHDGRFATLEDVVAHYDAFLALGLAPEEQQALVQHLLSL